MRPLVTVLTYCAHPALAYGTLLVFKTIRTGFPDARIEVFDNGSCPEIRDQVACAAAAVDAEFTAMTPRHYADHHRWLLLEREHADGPLVIVDPDVIFWQSVEGWDFGDAVMAGRLMPAMVKDDIVGLPRLHPSMLWVPDVARLRAEVRRLAVGSFAWDGIGQRTGFVGGQRFFWDTLAGLYQAMPERCMPFREEHLDAYDHLFYGSHLPLIEAALGAEGFDPIRTGHRAAALGQLEQLRGIWRSQEAFFSNRIETTAAGASGQADRLHQAALDAARRVQGWQGLRFDDAELMKGLSSLGGRLVEASRQ